MSDERASDAFDCINDPQIIANWNQTVIYVAHFIRNKSMMHAPAQLVQFNLINSYKKVKRTLVPSQRSVCAEMCIVVRGVRSADVCRCFYLLRVPLNDSCHSCERYISRRRFLTVINCFWFPYLIRIAAGNGCSNQLVLQQCVVQQKHKKIDSTLTPVPNALRINMWNYEWFLIGDTLQYTHSRHIYSSPSSSAINWLRRQFFFSILFVSRSTVQRSRCRCEKRLNAPNRGREYRDNHTGVTRRQSSLHIVQY